MKLKLGKTVTELLQDASFAGTVLHVTGAPGQCTAWVYFHESSRDHDVDKDYPRVGSGATMQEALDNCEHLEAGRAERLRQRWSIYR